jgi:hypothetical protein
MNKLCPVAKLIYSYFSYIHLDITLNHVLGFYSRPSVCLRGVLEIIEILGDRKTFIDAFCGREKIHDCAWMSPPHLHRRKPPALFWFTRDRRRHVRVVSFLSCRFTASALVWFCNFLKCLVFHTLISLSSVFICGSSWILWLFMYQGAFRMDRRALDWKRWNCLSMKQILRNIPYR